jgi:cytochrome c-type biogenesis protein CcmH
MTGARRWLSMLLAGLLVLAAASGAHAVQPDEMLPDPGQEARARHLSQELRCLVCQNQSIDDSDAPLARDLRLLVRERIKAGDSNAAIRKFLVARYGEFVLLRPPFAWNTFLLWLLPFLALAAGATGILLAARRKTAIVAAVPLSEDEQRALNRALEDG